MRKLHIEIQTWPVDGTFVIARGAKREAVVVVSKLSSAGFIGLGECVPYARYGETPEQTTALIERMRPSIEAGASRSALQTLLPPGAARDEMGHRINFLDPPDHTRMRRILNTRFTPRMLRWCCRW